MVPSAVKVYRTPPKVIEAVSAPNPPWQGVPEVPVATEPEAVADLEDQLDRDAAAVAEQLARVSVVPAAELAAPAVDWDDRDEMPDVEIKVTVPTWVARRVFDVLEQASREAKAAGRLWGTET